MRYGSYPFFMSQAEQDRNYLARCLQLARLGGVTVQPNPQVGSVIVHHERIIGEGYHAFPGGPHAEVKAVAAVRDQTLLRAATLYVSLEPCNHFGKTPPCTDLILQYHIPRVVIGCLDPNPKVAGSGRQRLRDHGVQVEIAPDPTPFLDLNRIFFINHQRQRPYLTLKWAESADGFIAARDKAGLPQRIAISGRASQREVHRLRGSHQAILVGRHTAMIDNPRLDTRLYPGPSPLRLVWDRQGDLPADLTIFRDGQPTWTLGEKPNPAASRSLLIDPEQPEAWLSQLWQAGIASILVEGGSKTLQTLLDLECFDEVIRIVNPALTLGQGVVAPKLPEHLPEPGISSHEGDQWHQYRCRRYHRVRQPDH